MLSLSELFISYSWDNIRNSIHSDALGKIPDLVRMCRYKKTIKNDGDDDERVWMGFTDNWQMAKLLTDNWQIA